MIKILALIAILCLNNFALSQEVFNNSSLILNTRFKRSFSCGAAKKSDGLIIGGNRLKKGTYPWITVLMDDSKNEPKYFCGGVLVSTKKVLTAAHCIYPKNEHRKLKRDIIILLGVYDIKKTIELERVAKTSQEIIIHPDWNPKARSFDGDICVLLLDGDVQLSSAIQPVCLWTSNNEPTATFGTVVGYGKSEDETKIHETIPKQLEIPIISSNEDCFLAEPDFAKIASKRTFCAGSRDGTSPCLGDSGNGLFIKQGNIFYLRGLVSSAFLDGSSCDTSKYALFTNVLKYKDWIDNPSEEYDNSENYNQKPITTTTIATKPTTNWQWRAPSTTSKRPLLSSTTTTRTTRPSTVSTTTRTRLTTTTTRPKTTSVFSSNNHNHNQNTQRDSPQDVCGVMSELNDITKEATFSKQNQFPWIVSISRLSYDEWKYFGTGSLVSHKHVIAKSFGVSDFDESDNLIAVSPGKIKIFLGATIHDSLSDLGALQVGATKIVNHRGTKKVVPRLIINQASIITLDRYVTFTDKIRPACLWPYNDDLNSIIGREVYAVGYYQVKSDFIRAHLHLSIADFNEECKFYYDKELEFRKATKLFCTKSENTEKNCGSYEQLFIKIGTTWYHKGILGTFYDVGFICKKSTLYEDITPLIPWIKSQIS